MDMNLRLHKNATTTPARRADIQTSSLSVAALAIALGVTADTLRRWKGRDRVADRSHPAHRLQTTLTPAQEAVVVARRKTWWLPRDDLLVITRAFIHEAASRSALSRLLRRHGLSRLPVATPTGTPPQTFKTYEPGYRHLDVKYLPPMADETTRRDRFVAIDRATRWVYIAIKPNKTAASARACLHALHPARSPNC
jgi:hypothetical protein